MRGRSLHLEVYPLSFPEFLRFREVEVKPKYRASEAKVIQCMRGHFEIGGFPEVVLAEAAPGLVVPLRDARHGEL